MEKVGIFHVNQKYMCLDPHRSWEGAGGASGFVNDRSGAVLLLWMFFLYLSLPSVRSVSRSLLGKGWPLVFPVCDVFLCFCQFPIWCPGSGLVLDCIDF